MTARACPSSTEWARLVDGEVTANRSAELRDHSSRCDRCAETLRETHLVIADVATRLPAGADAVARTMAALDDPAQDRQRGPWRPSFALGAFAGGAMVAAAAAALFVFTGPRTSGGTFTARGGGTATSGGAASSLERAVGVDVYAAGARLRDGSTVSADAPFSAGARNLASDRPVYMLLFAVDARGDVHWLFPGFVDPATDPASVSLPHSDHETHLGERVVLEAPAAGPMTLVTVLSYEPLRVSHIENASRAERSPAALARRWPSASVRSLGITVTP